MKKQMIFGGLIVASQILGGPAAVAGPWEDGMAAYNRGDYVPGDPPFPSARRTGQCESPERAWGDVSQGTGVARNSVRAFLWLNRAAARGDAIAKAELHEVTQTMTPDELSQAREMAQACEASDYRSCEY